VPAYEIMSSTALCDMLVWCVALIALAATQAGWKSPEATWRELPAEELMTITQMLAIRDDVNQVRLADMPGTTRLSADQPSAACVRVFGRSDTVLPLHAVIAGASGLMTSQTGTHCWAHKPAVTFHLALIQALVASPGGHCRACKHSPARQPSPALHFDYRLWSGHGQGG